MTKDKVFEAYLKHRAALIDYAGRISDGTVDAEDIVQEAWAKADGLRQRGGSSIDQPLFYFYRIVRNLVITGYRRAVKFEDQSVTAESLYDTLADDRPSPEVEIAGREQIERLQAAMNELPERTRIALEMYKLGGCKLVEIAGFFDMTVPAVHAMIVRGLRHCRRRLDED
ncbi:sigma-70 family RNA polymerase sigma factor [Acetobacter vaccinii]|uniref:Sigma-70 family RNA polymerase sigma factor n=1 Tax=Acetobacter vaccinii TaxID=2592655 RepID=A0A5C1YL90_9PROT|nr:sigma-70 family RNA polymerase sigma factor [Acetobacter vaccinii]QEO17054.1 sigma-70 family RNA polymerase sigma factor [Acetobacter vaccinii]